jgi:phage-related protein
MAEPLRIVVFYRSEAGREPVREWLKNLNKEQRKRIGKELAKLQFYRVWPSGTARFLRDGLWELRVSVNSREARLVFFQDQDRLILVHAFWKTTQTTPLAVLSEALERKAKYEKREC